MDVGEEVGKIHQAAPFISITGIAGDDNCQVFLCGEGNIFFESASLKEAMIDLLSFYFVFDICYPKWVNSILLFFQHYVFKVSDSQPVPTIVTKLVGNLNKL